MNTRKSNISDGFIHNVEPATGKRLPPVKISSPDDVNLAVTRARKAQKEWAKASWQERRRRLLNFRNILINNTDKLCDVLVRETGKPGFEALTHEILPIVDLTNFFARNAHNILKDEPVKLHLFKPIKKSYLQYLPRGVVGVISPWNFPFSIPMGDVVMALASGNAVVVKPSEWTPGIMNLAKEMLLEAKMDPDLMAVVHGGGEVGETLVQSGVDMMIFTGSAKVGKLVGEECGKRLVHYVAECGGKDVAIVLKDADLDEVAKKLVWGAFANSGQICASIERCLVHSSHFDALVAKIVEFTEDLRQGDPIAAGVEQVDLGAMVMPSQMELVQKQVEDAVTKGASVLTGGHPVTIGEGRFFEPTVLVNVDGTMDVWNLETFGPCLPIRKYDRIEEAVAIANDTQYGLCAYVFSKNVAKAEKVATQMEAGTVVINDVLYTHALPETPWGGTKQSGMGRVHGSQGLRDMCQIRHINKPRLNASLGWGFPYTETKMTIFNKVVKRALRGFFGG